MASSHSRPHPLPATSPDSGVNSRERVARAVAEVPRDGFEAFASGAGTSEASAGPASTDVIETMLSSLALAGTERVLCIGCAVGYPAALLSHLAQHVDAVEIDAGLLEPQRLALAQLGRTNVTMMHADGVGGRHFAEPFQAILVTAAASELPHALIAQLAVGGRLVIPLGDARGQLIELLEKRVDTLVSRTLGACALPLFPSLQGTPSSFPWTMHHEGE
jgi:protein-L-isoaspartate(D-aspartate) O-methyltransferase